MAGAFNKNEFLAKLGANLPENVSFPVARAIVDNVDPILGVALAKYEKYAELSATGLRTVARTIPALHRHSLLGKQSRHNGPPVLWLPQIMDMQADEALRRASWLAHHKDENPQNYFTAGTGHVAKSAHARRVSEQAGDEIDVESEPKTTRAPNPSLDTGTQRELRQQHRAKSKSAAYANDREILRLIYRELDARGLTPGKPEALSIAIHALGKSKHERFRHLDGRALRKAFQRARARLPEGYDRWVGLVTKWDRSYTTQKARNLVDRLITAIGNRPRRILERVFEHLEQQFCESWSKKVKRLELQCEHLEKDEFYMPRLRDLKSDDLPDRVYGALASGAKTRKQLSELLGRTRNAITGAGLHLRDAGLIETTTIDGRFTWTRVGTAPLFVRSREAILAALKEGPMNVARLAETTGKVEGTIVRALQLYLLPNDEVIRTKRGIYALPETAPPYISKSGAIVAALKKGPMTISDLCQSTSTALDAIYQYIRPLLADRRIIRSERGVYALPSAAPVFVTTDHAIIRALRRRPMRLPALARHIKKPPTTVLSGLARLKKAGTVKHGGWGAEYRLARRVRMVRRVGSRAQQRT